jgi:hypothetical protein
MPRGAAEIAFVASVVSALVLMRLNLSIVEKRAKMLGRIDAKLDLLLKNAGIEFDPYKSLPAGVGEAVQRGEKIRAIKYYREATGFGLKEAKDFIEEVQRPSAWSKQLLHVAEPRLLHVRWLCSDGSWCEIIGKKISSVASKEHLRHLC